MKITTKQLRRIIKEAMTDHWDNRDKIAMSGMDMGEDKDISGISFDWGRAGLQMIMSVDGKEVIAFSTQKDVRDLIKQLEDLLAGPMRTTG